MSKKEMEKNLSYGDCFNFFGALFSNLLGISDEIENTDKNNNNLNSKK